MADPNLHVSINAKAVQPDSVRAMGRRSVSIPEGFADQWLAENGVTIVVDPATGKGTVAFDPGRPSERTACMNEGHSVPSTLPTGDGSLIGRCDTCGELVFVQHMPGGMAVAQAERLVALVLGDAGDATDAEVLFAISETRKLLDGEIGALQRTQGRLAMVERTLITKVLSGE